VRPGSQARKNGRLRTGTEALTSLEPAVLSSRSVTGLPPELKRTCQFALNVLMSCMQRRKNLERIANAAHDAELRRMGTAGIQSIDGRVVDRIRNNPVGICVLVRISVSPHAPRKPICVWRPLVRGCVQSLTFPMKAEGSMPHNRVVLFDRDFLGQQGAYADQHQSGRPCDLRPPIDGEPISSCARRCAVPAPGNHRSRKQECLA